MANIYVDYFDVVLLDMTFDAMRAITIAAQNVSPEIVIQVFLLHLFENFFHESTHLGHFLVFGS